MLGGDPSCGEWLKIKSQKEFDEITSNAKSREILGDREILYTLNINLNIQFANF